MRTIPIAVLLALLPALAPAQDTPAAGPKRSLADGQVRQWIERDGLKPPRLGAGLELGAGKGPLVLMIRRADGTLSLHELERGAGDHGPAAGKAVLPDVPGVEVEEEVVEEAEQGKPPAGEKPKAAAPAPAPTAFATIRLRRSDAGVSVGASAAEPFFTAERVDGTRLLPHLERMFERTRGTEVAGHLVLEATGDTLMQDVLTTWEVAQQAGFTVPMIGGGGNPGRLSADDAETIAGLAERFGWPVEHRGPDGRQPICNGELLILLDGPTRFAAIEPMLYACARAGIWQLGYVGQKDARTRAKVRTNLPFDRGL